MNIKRASKFRDKEYTYTFAEGFVRSKVASQIKSVRKRRKLTQEDLASAIGSGQSRVNEFENPDYGKMNMETLFKLARALGVIVDIEFKPVDRFALDAERLPNDWLSLDDFESASNRLVERQSVTKSQNDDRDKNYQRQQYTFLVSRHWQSELAGRALDDRIGRSASLAGFAATLDFKR